MPPKSKTPKIVEHLADHFAAVEKHDMRVLTVALHPTDVERLVSSFRAMKDTSPGKVRRSLWGATVISTLAIRAGHYLLGFDGSELAFNTARADRVVPACSGKLGSDTKPARKAPRTRKSSAPPSNGPRA